MNERDVFITGLSGDFEARVRSLVKSTLTRIAPAIEIVALRMDNAEVSAPSSIGLRCTILAKTSDSSVACARSQDCDEVVAVYKATTALLDQLPDIDSGAMTNRPAAPA